jgi:hypothetical protein
MDSIPIPEGAPYVKVIRIKQDPEQPSTPSERRTA